jgi:hypothetical protein
MVNIPTTKEIKEINLTNLESRINQDSPLNDRAFLKVLAVVEAVIQTGLYKFAAERSLQNLVSTATGDFLIQLGLELEVFYKEAEATILEAEISGSNGVVIPSGTAFNGVLNEVIYLTNADATISGGIATLELTAQKTGTIGNLNNGSELYIRSLIADVDPVAIVTDTINVGTEAEEEEAYRERVLFAYRAVLGAGNSSDYKVWAERVSGVKRVYPFTGKPYSIPTSCPGDRTIFVEATTDVDPDGIAPSSLLEEVREAINYDSEGREQIPLGVEDSLLYIESIERNEFFVKIISLVVDPAKLTALQADISIALDKYFREIVRPYVIGIDPIFQKNDVITQNFVSDVVADPLKLYGASCSEVQFSKEDGVPTPVLSYTLENNELAKLGGITYA